MTKKSARQDFIERRMKEGLSHLRNAIDCFDEAIASTNDRDEASQITEMRNELIGNTIN